MKKKKLIFNHAAPTVAESVGLFSDLIERVMHTFSEGIKKQVKEKIDIRGKETQLYEYLLTDGVEEIGFDINNPAQVFAVGMAMGEIKSMTENKHEDRKSGNKKMGMGEISNRDGVEGMVESLLSALEQTIGDDPDAPEDLKAELKKARNKFNLMRDIKDDSKDLTKDPIKMKEALENFKPKEGGN